MANQLFLRKSGFFPTFGRVSVASQLSGNSELLNFCKLPHKGWIGTEARMPDGLVSLKPVLYITDKQT